MKTVVVKKQTEEKIKSLHRWIYKDEIKKLPKSVEKGQLVKVLSTDGKFLAVGYINPNSIITVRILTFSQQEINYQFFKEKIQKAIEKREKFLSKKTNAYRLIHSEADFLPGLIVDRYDKYLSVQFNTAGINSFRELILKALIETVKPEGIYEKVDEKVKQIEGLEENEEKVLYGTIPDEILITENQVKFKVNIKEGQKTGFFLDQRKNREVVSSYVEEGFEVLDMFSNAGGFGIYCLKKGAKYVDFVDISKLAVKQVEENCQLNDFKNYKTHLEDAFDFLSKAEKKYDLIILDPPPFAKTKKEKAGALKGFKYLIVNSLKLLKEGGYLSVFSCSHHITEKDLLELLLFASAKEKKPLQIVERLYQDIDHPVILNIPPSFYLKGFLVKVL